MLVRLAGEAELSRSRMERSSRGAITLPATVLVEATPDGSMLEPVDGAGITLTGEQVSRHAIVVGATGSGKTYTVAFPFVDAVLRQCGSSVVTLNTKGPRATAELCAAARAADPAIGVVVLAPFDPARSAAFNPVLEARAAGTIPALVSALVASVPKGSEETGFWQAVATDTLSAVLECEEITSLAQVFELFSSRDVLERFAKSVAPRHPRLGSFMTDYFDSGSHNAQTNFADIRARVATVAAFAQLRAVCCGAHELSPSRLLASGKRFLLVVECNESDFASARTFLGMFINAFLDAAVRCAEASGGRLTRDVVLVLDEFAGVGRLPSFEVRINSLRSRGVAIVALVQSVEQVALVYGPAASTVLAGFGTMVALCSGLSQIDRDYFARKSGVIRVQETVETDTLTADGDWETAQRTRRNIERTLFTADELLIPPHPVYGGFAVVFRVDRAPMLVHFCPAWENASTLAAIEAAPADPSLAVRKGGPLPAVGEVGNLPAVVAKAQGEISNTQGFTPEQLRTRLEEVKKAIGWEKTKGSARSWWEALEKENANRLGIVVRLAEELSVRKSNVTDFFHAFVYGNCENIQACLHYLDYTTLKKATQSRKESGSP
ncbi:MAG: type IV secretory system conjugative DNA transfer family protein [Phycisphaerales bacterium]